MRRATVLATRLLTQHGSAGTGPALATWHTAAPSASLAWGAGSAAAVNGARAYSWWGWGSKQSPDPSPPTPLLAGDEEPALPPETSLASEVVPAPGLDAASIVEVADAADAAAVAEAISSVWLPLRPVSHVFTGIHDALGGAWWVSVIVGTVAQRAALFPVTVFQSIHSHRLHQAKPDMLAIQALAAEEAARGVQPSPMVQAQRMQAVYKKHNTGPFKLIGAMAAQLPIGIGVFTTLRAMAVTQVPSYVTGGTLWFTDLGAPDPYYILPFLISASFATALKYGMDGMPRQDPNEQGEIVRKFLKFFPWVIGPASAFLSSGLQLTFLVSNVFSFATSTLLRTDAARKAMGLPPVVKGVDPTTPAAAARPAWGGAAASALARQQQQFAGDIAGQQTAGQQPVFVSRSKVQRSKRAGKP